MGHAWRKAGFAEARRTARLSREGAPAGVPGPRSLQRVGTDESACRALGQAQQRALVDGSIAFAASAGAFSAPPRAGRSSLLSTDRRGLPDPVCPIPCARQRPEQLSRCRARCRLSRAGSRCDHAPPSGLKGPDATARYQRGRRRRAEGPVVSWGKTHTGRGGRGHPAAAQRIGEPGPKSRMRTSANLSEVSTVPTEGILP